MSRHFYTDPLAAAWMAKHFGMRFCSSPDGVFMDVDMPVSLIDAGHRGYIHPDSLQVLRPIPTGEDGTWNDVCNVVGTRFFGTYDMCLGYGGSPSRIRVVERNGKAFHWPECEGA